MRKAVIVAAVRTPVGKAGKGSLAGTRPEDLVATAIRGALSRVPGLDPAELDDVIVGCAIPEGEQGLNMARPATLLAGLPDRVPSMVVNRFCSSGLQSIALAAQSVMTGMAEVVMAGGAESMSRVPMTGNKPMTHPELSRTRPDAYLNMGLTAENVAERYGVSREAQDAFALKSHRRALAAQAAGRFDEEIVPVEVVRKTPGRNGSVVRDSFLFSIDEGPRSDTTLEALAKLKPVFRQGGTVTAGNASQTSDGGAMAVVMSEEKAAALGVRPLARFVAFAQEGVDPAFMGIGPVAAVPKALRLAGIGLSDLDLVELNEAFAAQAVAVIRELGLDPERVNVNGGAIALGHPLGCTGAKLTATLLHELARRGGRYGCVTMCIGGGMGAAGIFERMSS